MIHDRDEATFQTRARLGGSGSLATQKAMNKVRGLFVWNRGRGRNR